MWKHRLLLSRWFAAKRSKVRSFTPTHEFVLYVTEFADEVYVSSVKATVKYLVKVALKTAEYDDFVEIVSKLVDEFQDVIACFAVELTKKLVSNLFVSLSHLHLSGFLFSIDLVQAKLSLPLIDRPGPAHESFVWQSFYGVFTVILNVIP